MLNFVLLGVGIKLLSVLLGLEDTQEWGRGWGGVRRRLFKGGRAPPAGCRRNRTSEIVKGSVQMRAGQLEARVTQFVVSGSRRFGDAITNLMKRKFFG